MAGVVVEVDGETVGTDDDIPQFAPAYFRQLGLLEGLHANRNLTDFRYSRSLVDTIRTRIPPEKKGMCLFFPIDNFLRQG